MGQRAKIVRPFGVLAGRYEVSGKSLRLYQLSLWMAGATILFFVFGYEKGGPGLAFWLLWGAGFFVVTALCFAVTKTGKKLD